MRICLILFSRPGFWKLVELNPRKLGQQFHPFRHTLAHDERDPKSNMSTGEVTFIAVTTLYFHPELHA